MKVPSWKNSVSKESYLERIAEHFPEVEYEESELIRHGYDNDVVVLDNRLAFRFPTKNYAERFKAEVRLLKYLQNQITVPIPSYSYLANDLSFGGYKFLSGDFLQIEHFRTLSMEQSSNIAAQVGTFLSEMHSTPVSVASQTGFKQESYGYWWSKQKCEKDFNEMQELLFSKLENDEADWIEQQYSNYLALLFDFYPVVLHGDLSGDHILIDFEGEKVTGIIDFADVEIGDPAMDFVGLWNYGSDFVNIVLDNYEHAVDEDFVERSKFPSTVSPVPHMLEAVQGKEQYYSFEDNRARLRKLMKSD